MRNLLFTFCRSVRGMPRSSHAAVYNPFSVPWVCPGVSPQLNMPKTAPVGGIPDRCLNHLRWHFFYTEEQQFYSGPPHFFEHLTVFLRVSPGNLQRKLISVACICDHIPRSPRYSAGRRKKGTNPYYSTRILTQTPLGGSSDRSGIRVGIRHTEFTHTETHLA